MTIDRGHVIRNIYYMLAYAFRDLRQCGMRKVAVEKFERAADLCAAILDQLLDYQIKRGLLKIYQEKNEPLSSLRGKIDISKSVKSQTFLKRQLVCSYDELSLNSYLNQIVKTTLLLLLKSDLRRDIKQSLCKKIVYFEQVDALDYRRINWNISYDRQNMSYRAIIYICFLIVKGCIQTEDDGKILLMDFLDEQRMSRLYEKFLLEYFRKEFPEFHAAPSFIKWQLDDDFCDNLPMMQSDVMLSYRQKICIIDAKYYKSSFQKRDLNAKQTLISGNLYQIFSYVKNMALAPCNSGKIISGMLLYAKVDKEEPINYSYQFSGNKITARTLDLSGEFFAIKEQLNAIAEYLKQ